MTTIVLISNLTPPNIKTCTAKTVNTNYSQCHNQINSSKYQDIPTIKVQGGPKKPDHF